MFINIFQINFINIYILSPKTWIHKIQKYKKMLFIFIFLSLIPYINYEHILILIILFIIITNNIKISKKYKANLFNILLAIIIFSLDINNINLSKNFCVEDIINISIHIKIPYFFNEFFKKYFDLYILTKYYYILIIPKFIFRGLLITILYSICIKILFLTTLYEDIICYCLAPYIKLNNKIIKKIYFTTILSCQFLALFINQIITIITAIKLRNTRYTLMINYYKLYYYAFNNLLIFIENNIQKITSVLYSREIKSQNLIIIDIYNVL